MPNELTADEQAELKAQGIDPSTAQLVESPEQGANDKIGIPSTVARVAKARAGGWVGAGMGAARGAKYGAMAGAAIPVLGETGVGELGGGLIGGAVGGLIGGYGGQKGQELVEGKEEADKLEGEEEQAREQNPKTAMATDIAGSALVGGGWPNISNIPKAAGYALGRNAIQDGVAPTVEQLAARQAGKTALSKVALSSVVNPVVNAGVNYAATGNLPTGTDLAGQFIGGALFSEQSRLGAMMGGHKSSLPDEPLPEPAAKDITLNPTEDRTSPYNTQEGSDGYIDDKGVKQAFADQIAKTPSKEELGTLTPEQRYALQSKIRTMRGGDTDSMRDQLHQLWLKNNPPEPSAQDQSTPDVPNITADNKDQGASKSQDEIVQQFNDGKQPPRVGDDLTPRQITELDVQNRIANPDKQPLPQTVRVEPPSVPETKTLPANPVDRQQDFSKAIQEKQQQDAVNPPPLSPQDLRNLVDKKALLPNNLARPEVRPPAQPEPVPGDRLVTVKGADGTTYQASFGDKYYEDVPGRGKVPSIARLVNGQWSHGMLSKGEQIVEGEKSTPFTQPQKDKEVLIDLQAKNQDDPDERRIKQINDIIDKQAQSQIPVDDNLVQERENIRKKQNSIVKSQQIDERVKQYMGLALEKKSQGFPESQILDVTARYLSDKHPDLLNKIRSAKTVEDAISNLGLGVYGGKDTLVKTTVYDKNNAQDVEFKNQMEHLDNILNKLKIKNDGTTYAGLPGIAHATWNMAIDTIKTSIRAGRAVHEAIRDGIEYIKKMHPEASLDDQQLTAHLTKELQPDTKQKEVTLKTNHMGFLGNIFKSGVDKVREVSPRLSDAFKQVNNTREQRVGATWNKLKQVMDKVGYDEKTDGKFLQKVADWENLHHQPYTGRMTLAQRAVYEVAKEVYKESGEYRMGNKEPVYRNGKPTQLRPDPTSHPMAIAPKIMELYKNGTNTQEIAKYDKLFLDNATKQGLTPEKANEALSRIKMSLQGSESNNKSRLQFFNGARIAQGTPLPKEWGVDGYAKNLESYYRRMALDNAFYKHVESDPAVMAQLGESKDAWGNVIKPTAEPVLGGNDHVRNALNEFKGQMMNTASRDEGAITNLAATLFVSNPAIEMHKIASNVINGPLSTADNPIQFGRILTHMVMDFGKGLEHATENGVVRLTARSVDSFFDSNATFAERIQALSQGLRNISSLGGRTDKFNVGSMQAGFERALAYKQQSAAKGDVTAQQLLKKIDPTYKVGKQYDQAGLEKLSSLAIAYTQGTHDSRTMPHWMMQDNELSGFFKLAHWSISQTNRFMSDVYTPAIKGDVRPLFSALLGASVGGYLIRKMREEMQGKHGNVPDLTEIASSEKGLEGNKLLLGYNLISAAQYAGFGGMLSSFAKWPMDVLYKNNPQGSVFPLDEIASDMKDTLGKFTSAYNNDPNFNLAHASMELITHIFMTDIQLSRVVINQGINNGMITGSVADRKQLSDKLSKLRRFDMVSGLPYDDQTPSNANEFMNLEQKKFKREQDLGKAMDMLPGLIDNIVSTYGKDPDIMMAKLKALKENQYETFPSIENMPIEYMKYLAYLQKMEGPEKAQAELQDYMKHKTINEVKAGIVP